MEKVPSSLLLQRTTVNRLDRLPQHQQELTVSENFQ